MLNVWKLITVVVGDLIVDHAGRRPILLGGTIGMAASLLGVGGILREAARTGVANPNGAVVLIALYIFFYEVSVGPLLWVLSSEMFPTQVRARSAASTWQCTRVLRGRRGPRQPCCARAASAVL